MVPGSTCVFLLLAFAARGDVVQDLGRVRSTDGLARVIFSTPTNAAALRSLLVGLDSTNSIRLESSSAAIPVREICATIIEDRFESALGRGFREPGRTYGVREICSFQDRQGGIWRYHIGIYDDRQYREMKELLAKRLARTPLATAPGSIGSEPGRRAGPGR